VSVIQFVISKPAARAVSIDTIKPRGRDAGVPDVRFGYSDTKAGFNKIRVTCSIDMALFLEQQLKACALADRAVLVDCSEAIGVIFNEIDAATRRPPARDTGG
jgi:hypothetical protein